MSAVQQRGRKSGVRGILRPANWTNFSEEAAFIPQKIFSRLPNLSYSGQRNNKGTNASTKKINGSPYFWQ